MTLVIAFDGACGLCDRFVQFMLRHDHRRAFTFAASTSQQGRVIFRQTGQDPDRPSAVILLHGEAVYLESEAAIRAVGLLGGGFALAGVLLVLPRGLRDAGYRFVARRRYRWFGRESHCALPEAGWADRFLT